MLKGCKATGRAITFIWGDVGLSPTYCALNGSLGAYNFLLVNKLAVYSPILKILYDIFYHHNRNSIPGYTTRVLP